jgi:hypothetical protein
MLSEIEESTGEAFRSCAGRVCSSLQALLSPHSLTRTCNTAEMMGPVNLVLLHFAGIGNPASNKSIGAIFPTCAHFVSLYHILVIVAIFSNFQYYYIC